MNTSSMVYRLYEILPGPRISIHGRWGGLGLLFLTLVLTLILILCCRAHHYKKPILYVITFARGSAQKPTLISGNVYYFHRERSLMMSQPFIASKRTAPLLGSHSGARCQKEHSFLGSASLSLVLYLDPFRRAPRERHVGGRSDAKSNSMRYAIHSFREYIGPEKSPD